MGLDKQKPHGKVCGNFGHAVYEQGGKYFDGKGNLLDDQGMPLESAPAEPQKQPENTQTGEQSDGLDDGEGAQETANATETGDNTESENPLDVNAQLGAGASSDDITAVIGAAED